MTYGASIGNSAKRTAKCTSCCAGFEFLKSKLQLAIGENKGITGVASWEWVQRWTMNLALFEKTEPKLYAKLYEKYKRDSGSRKFALEQVDLTTSD